MHRSMLRFPAGFVVACVGFLACVSVGVAVSIETELDVSISRTFAADFLDSNEIASPFLSQSQNASTCGPGAYCVAPFMTNSSSLLPCPLGFACPGNETGRYCPAGFYCPTPSKIIPCPADHFCPPGRVKPLACPWGSLCPEQSSRYVFLGGIILLCSIIPILLALEKCSALCAFTRRVGGFEPKKKISPGVAMLVDLYRKQLAKMQTENGKSGEPSLIPTRLQSNVVNPSALSRQDSARISLFSSSHSDSRDDIKHNGLAEPRGSNSDIWKETKEFDQKLMLPVSAVSSNELGRRINYNGTTQGDSPEESRQADRSHSDEVKEPSSGNGSGNGSGSGSGSPAGGGSGLITTSASGWSEIGMGALERVQPRRESFILHQAEAERGNPAGSDSPPNPVGGSGSASPLIPVAESAHGDHVLLSPRNAHNQDPLAPTVFSAKPFLKALQPLFEISKRQLTFSFDFSASLRSVALLPEEIAAALFHEQLNVSFENLHAQINVAGARRTIVENVTGHFRCGRVCAIMGPSGSGKSSLLSLLTGKLHKSSGRIIINGREDEISNHRRAVGFVPQDDIMLPLLTVEDVLTHSAALRTPTTLSAAQRRVIVDKVLEILNLTHVRHNVIGDENTRGLSGGEKKRVNIGLELVSNPSMLLLDECTTGLDSSQSMAVMRVLRAVAQKQVTIVAVLHQPRPEIVNMLDDLLLLAPGGRTVFFGPASEAPDYFDSLGFPCPVGTSPADWYLDVLSGKVQPKAKAVKKEKFANQFRNFSTRRYNRLRERRLRLGMQNGITSDVGPQKSRSERPDFEFSAEYKYGDITTTNMRSLGRASPSNRTNGGAELFGGIGTGTVRSVRSVASAIELVPPADRIPDSEPSAYGPEGESKKFEFPNPESEEDEAVVERVLEAVREAEESFSRPVVEDEPDEKAVPVEDLASLHVDPAYKDQRYLKKAKEKKVVVTKSQAEIFDYLVGCWTTAQGTNQRRSNININVNVNESAPSSPKITSRHPGAHLAHDASDSSLLTLNRTETNSTVPFERNASLYGVQRTDTGSTLPNVGLERNASLLTVQRTDTGSTIPIQRSDTLDSQAPVVRTDTNETVSSYESGYQLFPPSSPKPSPMVPLARLGPQAAHSQSMKHLSNPPTGSGTLTVPASIAPPAIVISPARDDRVLLHPNYAPPSPQHSRPQSPFDFNTNSAQVTSNAVSIESGGPMLAPPSHAQKFLLKQGSSRSPNRSPNQTVRLKPNAKAASLANLNPNHPPETGVLGSRQQLRQTLPSQEALQKISRLLAAPAPDHNGNSVSEMSVTVSVSEAATEHTGGGELFFPPPVGIDSHTAEHSSNTPERSGLGGETTNETGDVWEDENLEPPASPPMGSVSHSAATDATGATWGAGSRAARIYNRAARQAAESGERLPARNALMAEKSPEHSLLSGMTNRDPFAAYTHQFVRYPGIGRQVWLFTKRTWLQEFRSLRVFTLELALFIVGGLLNGLSYVDNFDFLPPLPLDFVAFCPPLIRNACATLPIKGDLFNMIGVTCTMSGLIAATSATRHFAGQMELYNFFREQEAGASPLAYFLGKMLALLPHSFIHAFFYLLGFYALAAPAAEFWDFFVLLFLFFLISESIGFVTTTWIASEEAAILVSGVSACVAGLGAPKDDFSKEFCWSSYFGEALFGTAVRPDAFSPEINQVTRQYADFAFGYNLDHYARNCLILLAFLVVLRSISFVGLKYRVYQRQH